MATGASSWHRLPSRLSPRFRSGATPGDSAGAAVAFRRRQVRARRTPASRPDGPRGLRCAFRAATGTRADASRPGPLEFAVADAAIVAWSGNRPVRFAGRLAATRRRRRAICQKPQPTAVSRRRRSVDGIRTRGGRVPQRPHARPAPDRTRRRARCQGPRQGEDGHWSAKAAGQNQDGSMKSMERHRERDRAASCRTAGESGRSNELPARRERRKARSPSGIRRERVRRPRSGRVRTAAAQGVARRGDRPVFAALTPLPGGLSRRTARRAFAREAPAASE